MKNRFFKFWNSRPLLGLAILIVLAGIFSLFQFFSVDSLFVFTGLAGDSYTAYMPDWFQDYNLSKESFLSSYTFYEAAGNAHVQNIPLDPVGFLKFMLGKLVMMCDGVGGFAVFYFFAKFIISFLGTGLFVYLWLRTVDVNKYSAVIAGIFAAFSSSIVVLAPWNIEFFGFYFAFYLFGFEQLFVKKRPYFLAIAVAMLSGYPYHLYLYSLFVGIYMVFRFFVTKCSFRRAAVTCLWIFGMGVLGILINFPDFVNNLYVQLNTPRMGDVSFANTHDDSVLLSSQMLATTILRLFANNIQGNDFVYSEWNNYLEAPAIYSGLLTLVVLPQIFQSLNRRKKLLYACFIGLWVAVMVFPPIRRAIVLYAGDYYRYGIDFFFTFAMLFVMSQALSIIIVKRNVNIPLLMCTVLVLGISLWKSSQSDAFASPVENTGTMLFSILLMVVYTLLLFCLGNFKNSTIFKVSTLCMVLIEVVVMTYSAFDGREAITKSDLELSKAGYNDGVEEALDFIRQNDSSKFYRTELNFYPGYSHQSTMNCNKVLNYFTSKCYNSFNQPEYVKFLQAIGQAAPRVESDTRWLKGIEQFPFIYAFMSSKYLIVRNQDTLKVDPPVARMSKHHIFPKHTVYQSDYVMPLGFSVDKYLERADFDSLMTFQISMDAVDMVEHRLSAIGYDQNAVLNSVNLLKSMLGTNYQSPDKLYEDIYAKFPHEHALVVASSIYFASHQNIVQLYSLLIGFVNDEDSDIDLSKYKKINIRDTSDLVDMRKFSPSDFLELCNTNQKEAIEVTDFTNSHIKGNINVSTDKMMVLTIPYDKCWKCSIDGNLENIHRCDVGFIGVPLKAGNHTVELTYEPFHQRLARIIGLCALLLFIVFTFCLIRTQKTQNYTEKH